MGIVSYGTYLPSCRLDRTNIGKALGAPAGKGTRSVASYDEDTTTMGVEAARIALAGAPAGWRPSMVLFATSDPAYLDKTNATAIHAALGLDRSIAAYDMVGSVRSGVGAARAGAPAGALVIQADIRTGLPGSADEAQGGDGAVAFCYGTEGSLTDRVSFASTTSEFLDRWRIPGETSKQWEERFGERAYVPLADEAVTDALKQAGITADAVDHLIVTGVHPRAARVVAAGIGVRPEAMVDDLTSVIGNTGTPHGGIVLTDVLDRAKPGETILLVSLADGADATVTRTTDAITGYTAAKTVRQQLAAPTIDVPYPTFLTWRGQLHREPPRRPDPERPAAPVSYRREEWKFGFSGSRCEACGTRHLPPARVCVKCNAVDQMQDERLADVQGTIATFTVDRLAFSLSPPVVAAVIDFDGGGRFQCGMTDVDPATVKIGDRVEMTFRLVYTADGIHNYFWKARPAAGA
ncbi:MAG TPA: OB-fold domain-containing protein [Acidimicrobiales bacterium]|nr:OB-fold domain-containing protein [Acidimicrobiales bacterium]